MLDIDVRDATIGRGEASLLSSSKQQKFWSIAWPLNSPLICSMPPMTQSWEICKYETSHRSEDRSRYMRVWTRATSLV